MGRQQQVKVSSNWEVLNPNNDINSPTDSQNLQTVNNLHYSAKDCSPPTSSSSSNTTLLRKSNIARCRTQPSPFIHPCILPLQIPLTLFLKIPILLPTKEKIFSMENNHNSENYPNPPRHPSTTMATYQRRLRQANVPPYRPAIIRAQPQSFLTRLLPNSKPPSPPPLPTHHTPLQQPTLHQFLPPHPTTMHQPPPQLSTPPTTITSPSCNLTLAPPHPSTTAYQLNFPHLSFEPATLLPPPEIPKIYPLLLASKNLEVSQPKNALTLYHIRKGVVGLQFESRYNQIPSKEVTISTMMSPLSLEDINLMDMSSHWKAWDYIYIPLNPSDGVHPQVSPQRPFPTINMKIALWNIRGQAVMNSCHMHTKCDDKRAFHVKRRLNFTDYKVVNPRGKRGGIWLFWNPPVDLILFSDNDVDYFHGLFRFSPTSPEALVTGMHAPSVSSVRHRLWRDIQANLPPPTTPWMVLGDLNEVTCTNEKTGGNQFKHGQCKDFNNFQDNAGMIDLGFQGNPFTWTNGREGAAVIRERLDRAIANTKWLEAFPKTKVMHLTRTYSDHCPILVNLDSDNMKHGNYPFRCKENFMQNITHWNCNVFGNITKKKKKLLARLHGIQMSLANRFSPFLSNLESQLLTDLNDLYRIERTIWAQKAGLNWRKYGDYNTKYFHTIAKIKKNRQKILTLQDSHGNWITDDLELKNWACSYFATVLTTTQTTHPLEPSVFNPTTLSSAHQITLTSPVTMQEIKTNLFMMDPIKSPGPDGIQPLFYQKFWPTLAQSITDFNFSTLSGLQINTSKSSTIFPRNMHYQIRHSITTKGGFSGTTCFGKYLGVQISPNKLTKSHYFGLLDKTLECIRGWQAKLLNMAGRCTLIKSVLSSYPLYSMQTNILPISIVDSIEKKMTSWNKICSPLNAGGLGVRNLRIWNLTFMAKLGWKILTDENKLWVKLLRERYLRKCNFMDAIPNQGQSQLWRDVLKGRDILSTSLIMGIGDGSQTSLWYHHWVGVSPIYQLMAVEVPENIAHWRVADIIVGNSWSLDSISHLIPSSLIPEIMAIPISSSNHIEDRVRWRLTKHGEFTIKSAYHHTTNNALQLPHSKFGHLFGKLMLLLNTRCSFGMPLILFFLLVLFYPSKFPILIIYVFVVDLFRKIICIFFENVPPPQFYGQEYLSFYCNQWSEWMSFNLSITKNENWRSVFAIAIWHIWKMRNKAVFDGAMQNSTIIFNQFLSDYYASNKYLQINLVRPIIQDQLQKWRPPQSGFSKLNTDGSWRGIAAAGGGGVIRSEDGGWAIGFSASFHALEVDAKELLNLLNSGLDQPYHDLFVLIHEVSQMLKWDWVVILNHIHRDYNQVAHLLAYLSFYMEQDSKVYQEPPQYVQAAFRKDLGNVTSTSSGNT
ncbi:hypothetical protein RDABS01_005567 [Bienertia sinuspersici]